MIVKEYMLSKEELKHDFPIGSKHIIDGKEVVVTEIHDTMATNCMASYPMVFFEELRGGGMTENEAIEALKFEGGLEITGRPIRVAKFFEGIDVAIKALEEVQRWHTSEINPKIKNVFASTSTQICHNCDHKDEYIEELEAEVQRYRELGTPEELQTMKERSFTAFELTLIVAGQMLLKEYRAIGTVEECKEAVEKLKEMRGREYAE